MGRRKYMTRAAIKWVAVLTLLIAAIVGPGAGSALAETDGKPAFDSPFARVLPVGQTLALKVTNLPSGAQLVWSSSDETVASVDENGRVKALSPGNATIVLDVTVNGETSTLTKKIYVREANRAASAEPVEVTIGEDGFDAEGRMVAAFGSPVVDGHIDPVWEKATPVTHQFVMGETETTATFRALWDDRALYVLAEVKDANLSVESGTPYMQDSLEIFLDENNDKTVEYGPDDMHLRVNYENAQSADNGDPGRFYTAARVTEDGYIIEARVALTAQPANGKVLGLELQINDGVGTERVATLNVFDSSGFAWNDTTKFGEIVLVGKGENDESGPNPYDLMRLIERTLKMDFKLYKNPDVVTAAVMKVVAANFLGSEPATQAEIDEQYASIIAAIDKLEMTEEAANEKYFVPVPGEYRILSDRPGTIERLTYTTANPEGGRDEKKMNIYLPHGYDPADTETKYNVLYLMHGGGENEDLLFGGPGENRELKNILDHMIANGDIDPLIVVTPTFNGGMNDVALFHDELVHDIVPLVETTYNTYAKSGSLEDLKASRAHRAFGGFSMGSVTTWHVFANKLDYFKYYMPLSGDSWALGERSGGLQPKETAEFLANVARESGYATDEYYIFAATGDLDIAYPNLKPQTDYMRQMSDVFPYSSDKSKGNFYFLVAEGGTHAWNWQNQYIYDILPDLFD